MNWVVRYRGKIKVKVEKWGVRICSCENEQTRWYSDDMLEMMMRVGIVTIITGSMCAAPSYTKISRS